jgi:hypothetical protein
MVSFQSLKYHFLDPPNTKYGSYVPIEGWNVFYKKNVFHGAESNKVHSESTLGVT